MVTRQGQIGTAQSYGRVWGESNAAWDDPDAYQIELGGEHQLW
jgi:hypothetical protein